MKQFPLQLERYFFTEQYISANQEFNQDTENNPINIEQTINSDFSKTDEEEKYFISAEISLNREKSSNPPYFFKISVFGIISIRDKDTPNEVIESMIRTSGTQLVIGAVRERLAEMSSRGPWGMIHMDFIPISK